MPDMTKTTTVLIVVDEGELEHMTFGTDVDPGDMGRAYTIDVPRSVWEDLGAPDVITVTIEPGDTLTPEHPLDQ